MNRKTINSFLYQLYDDKKAVIIYYFIVIAVSALMIITHMIFHDNTIIFSTTTLENGTEVVVTESIAGTRTMNSVGFSTAIFLFCACAFKENFHMLMQNGFSRKSVYFGRIINSVVLSFILSIFDLIVKNLFAVIALLIDKNFIFQSIFDSMYYGYSIEKNAVLLLLVNFLFFFTGFICFHTLGFLMSTVFYRLSKTMKAIFAAGIPVSIFIILPGVDNLFFDGQIIDKILDLFMRIFGLYDQNPFIGILSLTIGAILFIALSWLPIRRARVE